MTPNWGRPVESELQKESGWPEKTRNMKSREVDIDRSTHIPSFCMCDLFLFGVRFLSLNLSKFLEQNTNTRFDPQAEKYMKNRHTHNLFSQAFRTGPSKTTCFGPQAEKFILPADYRLSRCCTERAPPLEIKEVTS